MEIETAPRLPAPTPWGRLVLLGVLFGPVILLVLLPIGLGLDRYVITGDSMAGSIDRGSIAFERAVPVSELKVGDVITYDRPGADQAIVETSGDDSLVTHRIVELLPEGIQTQGDALEDPDPWVFYPDGAMVSRVEFSVPWVGWAYLLLFPTQGWVLTVVSAVALVVLAALRLRRPSAATRRPTPATRSREATP